MSLAQPTQTPVVLMVIVTATVPVSTVVDVGELRRRVLRVDLPVNSSGEKIVVATEDDVGADGGDDVVVVLVNVVAVVSVTIIVAG